MVHGQRIRDGSQNLKEEHLRLFVRLQFFSRGTLKQHSKQVPLEGCAIFILESREGKKNCGRIRQVNPMRSG